MRLTSLFFCKTQSDIRASAEAAFVVLAFFVLAPTAAAVIGYRASNGKPKHFDREMFDVGIFTRKSNSLPK
jgi:multisubunit Na+/H+ antiporter MnhG subunit